MRFDTRVRKRAGLTYAGAPEGKGRGVGLLRDVSMRRVSIAVHDNFAGGGRGSGLGVPATIAIPLEFVVIDSIQPRRKD
jgi:hypothetical protein